MDLILFARTLLFVSLFVLVTSSIPKTLKELLSRRSSKSGIVDPVERLGRIGRKMHKDVEFAKLAAIVTDVEMNNKDMESAINRALPMCSKYKNDHRQRFLSAAKVMVAIVFAHGNVQSPKMNSTTSIKLAIGIMQRISCI